MELTKKNNPKSYSIYYMPQEIREITTTDVTYLPLTREILERWFQQSAKNGKHKLVKKNRK
jgi:hypothetical protein